MSYLVYNLFSCSHLLHHDKEAFNVSTQKHFILFILKRFHHLMSA
ncbi:hypothetical protein HMPREF9145_2303 [Segatella salivae F0493]|uniref:Uncharacterized protein n=1 Tax=Segatella salivae F0493 TaxID=1395125 RepID=U2L7I4_9BACT|nr:hypothetical protein HMPREF9145_2303 [Segatella salivae F0493]